MVKWARGIGQYNTLFSILIELCIRLPNLPTHSCLGLRCTVSSLLAPGLSGPV